MAIEERAESLQKWIDPPKWMDGFEQAQNRRTAGTCNWILDDPVYKNWRSEIQKSDTGLAPKTLSIQGIRPLQSLFQNEH
jgi:hypothetical protein